MATNNIALSTLTLFGIPIPFAGEGVFAEFTPDERYTVAKGVSTTIFNKVPNQQGTISIAVYPQDPAAPLLQSLVNQDNAALGAGTKGGQMTTSAGEIITFADGRITQEAPTRIEQEASVKTYTVVVTGYASQHIATGSS